MPPLRESLDQMVQSDHSGLHRLGKSLYVSQRLPIGVQGDVCGVLIPGKPDHERLTSRERRYREGPVCQQSCQPPRVIEMNRSKDRQSAEVHR